MVSWLPAAVSYPYLKFEMEGYGCDMLQVSVNTELDPFLDSFDSREE